MENSDTSSSNETTERKARRASGNQTLKNVTKTDQDSGDHDETSHSEGNDTQLAQASKDHNTDHTARSAFGSHCLKNTILDEVLSEKKKALLHSPEVMEFLREKMNK